MATIKSPLRSFVKPLLFKILGKRAYVRFQAYGKLKDIDQRLIDEPEMKLYPHFIKEDFVCLDIGANFAYHTHRLSNLCPKGWIHAFEPVPFTFKVFERICKHYDFKNVSLYEMGVGAKTEKMIFELPLQDFGGISAGQSHLGGRKNDLEGKEKHYQFDSYEEVECQVISIDEFFPDLKALDFIKMDIEGAEFFALKGMLKTLKKFKPIVLLEINPFFLEGFNIDPEELKGMINELGYKTYKVHPKEDKLIDFSGDYVEDNYILVHPENAQSIQSLLPV